MWACVFLHYNEIMDNCSPEKANINLQDIISIPHISHSGSSKHMDIWATVQHDAFQVHQTTAAVMVKFSDFVETLAVPRFSVYMKIYRESVVRLNWNSSVKRTVAHWSLQLYYLCTMLNARSCFQKWVGHKEQVFFETGFSHEAFWNQ